MKYIWGKLLTIGILLLTPFAALAWLGEAVKFLREFEAQGQWLAFGGGVCLIWPALKYLPDVFDFLATLNHELAHTVMGLCFLCPPTELHVTSHMGGHVKFNRATNKAVCLAPYCLPLAPYIWVLIAMTMRQSFAWLAFCVLGFLTGFHVIVVWRQARPYQSDLQNAGLLFSSVAIALCNLLFLTGIMFFVNNGARGFTGHWQRLPITVVRLVWQSIQRTLV